MPKCVECGRPAGWFSNIHPACDAARRQREAAAVPRVLDPVTAVATGHWVPVHVAPTLSTTNGFGARLIGRSRADRRANSYESTLYWTVLFLPVLPLNRYRVRRVGRRTYEFLAEGPIERSDWLRPVLWWAIAIAVALAWQHLFG